MRLAIITVAATAAAISTLALAESASPLPAAPPSGSGLPVGQCIRSHDIRNHTIIDKTTMLIDVNGRATYRVTTSGNCFAGAISSDPIITREPPGTSIICKPIEMDLAIVKGGFETRCIVNSIAKLTPEELAALPRRLKP